MDVVSLGLAKADAARKYARVSEATHGVRIYNPKALAPFSGALSDAFNTLVNVVCVGDSITVGVGSDGSPNATAGSGVDTTYRAKGYVGQLQRLFAATYGDTGQGGIVGNDNGARVTLTAASLSSTGPVEGGVSLSDATKNAAWSITDTCTSIDVYWWDGGRGQWTWSVDAGAATGTAAAGANTGSTNLGFNKTTISGLTSATHTLTITGTAAGSNVIAAVVPIKASTGVMVHRYGRSGNTTPNLIGTDSSQTGNTSLRVQQGYLRCPSPDLVVVPLGTNDFAGQNATALSGLKPGTIPVDYKANLQAFISAAAARSVPVLLVGEPRQHSQNYPAPMVYTEADYYDRCRELALSNANTAYIDIGGDLWGSNVLSQARGLLTSGSVHPTSRGHGSIARLLHRVLTTPFGENALAT